MSPRRWLHEHSLKLLAIRDTPEAIASGVAIGIFIGFTPLIGLKTALTILFAWLTRSNILAAVIASASHDILWPVMPVIFRWEYDVGYWLLSTPHHLPPPLIKTKIDYHALRNWSNLLTIGKPLLVGSLVCGAPCAVLSYWFSQRLVARHQRKKQLQGRVLIDHERSVTP
ncbi:MAG TPA: DUF2062 domain-containing protein [Candidatus Acidoferrum sp.]|nr:DUF2062 domain-containing protein [Candidatus Acidoferrum sp.]